MVKRLKRKPRRLVFEPLDNGLDYMRSVVQHLAGDPDDRDLKYAVVHLASAIEVLLKARLGREHWTLVVEKIDQTTRKKFDDGDFVSVYASTAMRRLVETTEIEFSDDDYSSVAALVQKRNRLQHHGLNDTVEGVRACAVRSLDFLLTFVHDNLMPDDDEGAVSDAVDEIREHLRDIKTFVNERRRSIARKLDRFELVVACPACGEMALELGEICRCHFCMAEMTPDEAADEYVSSVLGFSWHDLKDGADSPLRSCPSCGELTMVEGVEVRGDGDDSSPCDGPRVFAACFGEPHGFMFGEIENCERCGEATAYGADGESVCQQCYAYYMARD